MLSLAARTVELLSGAQAERDPEFRDELRRRSWNGLRIIGWAITLVPLVMSLAIRLAFSSLRDFDGSTGLVVCIVLLGVVALWVRRSGWLYDYARPVAFVLAVLVAWCLIWSSLLRSAFDLMFLYLINAQVSVVVLIVLLAVPFRPVQVLLIGLLAETFFFAFYRAAVAWTLIPDAPAGNVNLIFLSMLTALATAVSVTQYWQRHENFETHRRRLRASDDLRAAQCRMLLSDNAASMGRLAAALSHELNNPLAVLKSNLDTMRTLVFDRRGVAPEKIPAIEDMKSRLCQDAQESVERLRTTIERMQRFTNLDRAEVMRVDLCQLLRDVADVVADAAKKPPRFELALTPLPAIEVRPQLMSAVFSAVLQNAAEASPEGTPVRIETQMQDREVKVRVIDRGKGMTARELMEVMEPAFRVKDGRMTACNWNLFGARQIVRQHGGEITVRSEPGQGTTVEVVLPVR